MRATQHSRTCCGASLAWTLFAAVCLGPALSARAAAGLPKGVALYWHCDNDAGFSWRDNHWQKGGSPRVAYDSKDRVHGKASLRLEGKPGEDLRVVSLTKPAMVDVEQLYTLRFWAKTRGLKGKAEVRVLAHRPRRPDRTYAPLGWVRLPDKPHYRLLPDQDWRRHDVPLRRIPGGTGRLFVYLAIEGLGTVWFDEVSLAKEGIDVPLGCKIALKDEDYAGLRFDDRALPKNLLKNGDFEKGLSPWRFGSHGSSAKIEVRAGNAALRMDAREFTSLHVWQRARVDPRRRYRLSLRARTDDKGLTGYFFTHVLPFNRHRRPTGWAGADHATEFTYVTGKTQGWVAREQVFAVRPGTDAVNVYLYVSDTIGTVWIDDVRLEALPLDPEVIP